MTGTVWLLCIAIPLWAALLAMLGYQALAICHNKVGGALGFSLWMGCAFALLIFGIVLPVALVTEHLTATTR